MNPSQRTSVERLEQVALAAREHVLRMAEGGGCFVGASLSLVDLLVGLYGGGFALAPGRLDDPDRDFVLLSKGHAAPALYGTLAELGYFSPGRLAAHLSTTDSVYWHPNRSIPGVEFHSGSLGHLLSVGIGIALEARLRGARSRIFVFVGDGELNEGTLWEGLFVARAHRLGHLVLVVDRNRVQANVATEELVPLEPLAAKFEAFGWRVAEIDGHSFQDIERGLGVDSDPTGAPKVVIAKTVRGKGVPSLEGRSDKWFVKATSVEVERMIDELRRTAAAGKAPGKGAGQ